MITGIPVKSWRIRPHALPLLSLLLLAQPGHATAATPDAGSAVETNRTRLIIVVGAPGDDEFKSEFFDWADQWRRAGESAQAVVEVVGVSPVEGTTDRERIESLLKSEKPDGETELWLVLIGHGTFDPTGAKFNLVGPDLGAGDLASWLKAFSRPLAIINSASASAPFINALSGPNRVILTATKSGHEHNYARLGQHLSRAISELEADLDKDGQVSLLEAYLKASRAVADWYELEGRLATEHALLDDNGDGFGTPADWFRGIHAVKKAKNGSGSDGLRAHQFHLIRSEAESRMPAELRARRDQLELKVSGLRERRPDLTEEDYYAQLEALLLEMAHLYEEGARAVPSPGQFE